MSDHITPVAIPQPGTFVSIPADTSWRFPVDRPIRNKLFVPEAYSHPAKLHLGLLQKLIDLYTDPGQTLLDPMAGSGSLMLAATQQRNVILRDIQPEYVDLMIRSVPKVRAMAGLFAGLIDIDLADARTLECPAFDHVITSPPYGIECTASEISLERREKVRHLMGKRWQQYLDNPGMSSVANKFFYPGGQDNIGNKSGRNYWREMSQVYARLIGLMPSGGLLILILKNHYRRGKLRDVVGATVNLIQGIGLPLVARHARLVEPLSLWQRRRKEKGLPVVEVEDVLVFRRVR